MGMVVTFSSEKGGTGKSTTCINMAVVLRHKGFSVAILDADPKPASSTWSRRRANFIDEFNTMEETGSLPNTEQKKVIARKLKPKPIEVVRNRGDIDRTIYSLEKDHEFVLIDAGGMDDAEQRMAIGVSNVVVCPMKTGQFDLDTSPHMNHIIKLARTFNKDLRALFFINEAPTISGMSNTKDAKEVLNSYEEFDLCRTVIHKRNAYELTAVYGLGVAEWSCSKSRGEIEVLCKEIFGV